MAIWVNRSELIGTTSEIIGHKSGLGLTREEYADIIPRNSHNIWFGDDNELLRIYPEEFEELISNLLFKVGSIESPTNESFSMSLLNKYKSNKEITAMLMEMLPMFLLSIQEFNNASNAMNKPVYNPRFFFESSLHKFGPAGGKLAIEIIERFSMQMHMSPWAEYREVDWQDIIKLKELFSSRAIEPSHGVFIDQRYINYLGPNFDKIEDIHWRKFEALTCEFFERQGYYVEIGPGGNDGGIDARVWTDNPTEGNPPTILIQCKRYKERYPIEQIIVKGLHDDVVYEGADKGLIVTTSALAPGARNVIKTRAYPIYEANKSSLQNWIKVMRKPNTGIFMAR